MLANTCQYDLASSGLALLTFLVVLSNMLNLLTLETTPMRYIGLVASIFGIPRNARYGKGL